MVAQSQIGTVVEGGHMCASFQMEKPCCLKGQTSMKLHTPNNLMFRLIYMVLNDKDFEKFSQNEFNQAVLVNVIVLLFTTFLQMTGFLLV